MRRRSLTQIPIAKTFPGSNHVIEYRSMEQMKEQPIHWDDHRTKLNLTFIFALIVAVIGILGQPVLFVMGIGVAIYSWLTNPKQYLIYRDALVIIYGRPRIKSYPFQEISHLETLSLPMGERLRVRMVNGRRLLLLTKDTDTFRAKLDEALDAFHGEQRGSDYSSANGSESPMIIEAGKPSEVEPDIPPERSTGESSGENDDVPY